MPFPIYVIFGKEEQVDSTGIDVSQRIELSPNLICLGSCGIEMIGGLKVAYLSGYFDAAAYVEGRELPFTYQQADTARLMDIHDSELPVDILLTSEWGSGLQQALATSSRY